MAKMNELTALTVKHEIRKKREINDRGLMKATLRNGKVKWVPRIYLTDGRGLILVIGADGSRRWLLRVQHKGRRQDYSLGPAADVIAAGRAVSSVYISAKARTRTLAADTLLPRCRSPRRVFLDRSRANISAALISWAVDRISSTRQGEPSRSNR